MAKNSSQPGAASAPTPPEGATPGATPSETTTPPDTDQTPPEGDTAAAGAPAGSQEPPAPTVTPPEPPASPPSGAKKVCRIKNAAYAGMSVYGVSGKPCAFNAEGIAEVGGDDFEHFKKVPGYEPV